MPSFRYTAKNVSGQRVTGSIVASNQGEVVSELRKKNLTVLQVGKAESKKKGFSLSICKIQLSSKPKKSELTVFIRQLSTMISAGIPLLESLEVLKEQADSRGFAKVLDEVIRDIERGKDLSQSLERFPKVFSNIFVSMIRAGEASGQLDEILVRLAEYQEATEKLKSDIRSAMTYPAVSLCLVLGITAFLLMGVVPKFKEVFDTIQIPLPGLTSFILSVSIAVRENWMFVLAGAFSIPFLILFYGKTPVGRMHLDWVKLNMPVLGPLFRKVSLSRFSRTFATLIKSGVPILGSLEIVSSTSGNKVIARAVEKARENVRQGDTLSIPLSESSVFPPMVTKMIGIGERSGSLETLLEKISHFYDQQVTAAVKSLTSMIEPLLIAVMGFLVGGIVLAIFLPIMKLQEKISTMGG